MHSMQSSSSDWKEKFRMRVEYHQASHGNGMHSRSLKLYYEAETDGPRTRNSQRRVVWTNRDSSHLDRPIKQSFVLLGRTHVQSIAKTSETYEWMALDNGR